jgi:hypothetical protein
LDANQFDQAVRAIESGVQRRRMLGTFFAASLAAPLLGFASPSGVEAKRKKRRKHRKKIKRNSFGCVNVGQKCYGKSEVCCSGICAGTGKKSKCAGHNADTCSSTTHTCLEEGTGDCGGGDGSCFTTTGNAPFCGVLGTCDCAPCSTDADCVAEHGAGAACIQCAGTDDGFCTGVNGSSKGTACVPAWPQQL